MSPTHRPTKKEGSNVSVKARGKKKVTVAQDLCISKRKSKKLDYPAAISGILLATVRLCSETHCIMICVWRVFSHYKLPLCTESHADPKKTQANMLTEQWRQRVTHNLQRQAVYSRCRRLVYTSESLKSTLRAVKQNCKTGCLKSAIWREKSHRTKVGINTICEQGYTLERSWGLTCYRWFPFPSTSSSTVTCTWHFQSSKCKHVVSVTFGSKTESSSFKANWNNFVITAISRCFSSILQISSYDLITISYSH